MRTQPVLAYSIAGVAVAIAIAVVTTSTLGLTGSPGAAQQTVAGTVVDVGTGMTTIETPLEQSAGAGGAMEYVYVDDPQSGYGEDDDEHEREEHEDDDGHDSGGIFGLFRGEHDHDGD